MEVDVNVVPCNKGSTIMYIPLLLLLLLLLTNKLTKYAAIVDQSECGG